MYYEVNIAKGGQHFFATAKRSITSQQKLKEVFTELRARFPGHENWSLSVSYYREQGYSVDIKTDDGDIEEICTSLSER